MNKLFVNKILFEVMKIFILNILLNYKTNDFFHHSLA